MICCGSEQIVLWGKSFALNRCFTGNTGKFIWKGPISIQNREYSELLFSELLLSRVWLCNPMDCSTISGKILLIAREVGSSMWYQVPSSGCGSHFDSSTWVNLWIGLWMVFSHWTMSLFLGILLENWLHGRSALSLKTMLNAVLVCVKHRNSTECHKNIQKRS